MCISVVDPDSIDPYKSTRRGNYHLRGQKADGNKGNKPCSLSPCRDWRDCGRQTLRLKKKAKQIDRDIMCRQDIDELKTELARNSSFEDKNHNIVH